MNLGDSRIRRTLAISPATPAFSWVLQKRRVGSRNGATESNRSKDHLRPIDHCPERPTCRPVIRPIAEWPQHFTPARFQVRRKIDFAASASRVLLDGSPKNYWCAVSVICVNEYQCQVPADWSATLHRGGVPWIRDTAPARQRLGASAGSTRPSSMICPHLPERRGIFCCTAVSGVG